MELPQNSIKLMKQNKLDLFFTNVFLDLCISNIWYLLLGLIFFERNKFGRPQLICNGYKYYVHRRTEMESTIKTHWVCARSRTLNCKAKCVTLSNGQLIPGKFTHCHRVQ